MDIIDLIYSYVPERLAGLTEKEQQEVIDEVLEEWENWRSSEQ